MGKNDLSNAGNTANISFDAKTLVTFENSSNLTDELLLAPCVMKTDLMFVHFLIEIKDDENNKWGRHSWFMRSNIIFERLRRNGERNRLSRETSEICKPTHCQ